MTLLDYIAVCMECEEYFETFGHQRCRRTEKDIVPAIQRGIDCPLHRWPEPPTPIIPLPPDFARELAICKKCDQSTGTRFCAQWMGEATCSNSILAHARNGERCLLGKW